MTVAMSSSRNRICFVNLSIGLASKSLSGAGWNCLKAASESKSCCRRIPGARMEVVIVAMRSYHKTTLYVSKQRSVKVSNLPETLFK